MTTVINTDNLDRELAGIRALAIIGCSSEDDTEHLNHLFCAVLELTERAQAHVRNFAALDAEDRARAADLAERIRTNAGLPAWAKEQPAPVAADKPKRKAVK